MTANTRLKLGIAFAVGGNLLFFTSAWIAWMPWTASFKATLWSILFFAPETGTIIGAALMGRENYERFKTRAFQIIGRIKPAGDVGLVRHRTGLAMFFLPLLVTCVLAYSPQWLPDSSLLRWGSKIASVLVFLASFFVLGGDFWDKLHALFRHETRAGTQPHEQPTPEPPQVEGDAGSASP